MIETLRNIFFRDFWMKLFSVVLAVLIWLAVSLAIQRDVSPDTGLKGANTGELTFFNIPVMVMSSAADVHDFKVSQSEVTVKVRGETRNLKKVQASDIHAIVDLTGVVESARGLKKKIAVTTPANISYISVEPEEVEVIVPPKN